MRKLISVLFIAMTAASVGACRAHAKVGPAHAGAGVADR